MLTLTSTLNPPLSSSATSTLSPFRPSNFPTLRKKKKKKKNQAGACRAELQQDAPFAAAIGACMLSSLVLPNGESDEDKDSAFDSTDARFTVMGIISFIPYFNWLSWVFAWLDTGKRRYALYALVYLAPYLRTNMVLSPEESWLPIASIIFGIVHVQLEASIRNGDIEKFQLFSKATEMLSSLGKKEDTDFEDQDGLSEERSERRKQNLPSAEEQARKETRNWGVPGRPSEDHGHSSVDRDEVDKDDNERRKH